MATENSTQSPEFNQLSTHLVAKLGRAVEKIIDAGDAYRGLSRQLESASELRTDSDGAELRESATALRSIALHGIMVAIAIAATAERISVYAELREMGA